MVKVSGHVACQTALGSKALGRAGSSFVVVLLLLVGQSSFAATAARVPDESLPQSGCDRRVFRAVVDVGHSLDAPGALSARGVPEYQFNLLLAEQVGEALVRGGFVRTIILNTFGPARASLVDRVARANSLRADLFLSIHHDSVPHFLKEAWEYEGQAYTFSDRFRGHSLFVSARNKQAGASLTFARLLGRQLRAHGLQYTPHYTQRLMGPWQRMLVDTFAGVYRYDQLVVLRTTSMPAVLLEAGSIVHREEELVLASTERQEAISTSVVKAVQEFCSSRGRRGVPRALSTRSRN